MKKNIQLIVSLILIISLFISCSSQITDEQNQENKKLNVVTTTTMLKDLTEVIAGDCMNIKGLMGPGIDPHLYQASAGDVTTMQKSDIIIYNGLHLEGKMGEIFEQLSNQDKTVICIENGLDTSKLLAPEDNSSIYDPHIWFDISLWKDATITIEKELSLVDPSNSNIYKSNLSNYLLELDELETYIKNRVNELPEESRVLITAHDAFKYFGNAYGIEVYGLQGISTDAEAGTSDVSELANLIVDRQIKAIFIESSVPSKTIEALQASVKSKGFEVSIGGELYSDSLGGENSGSESYILTVKSNIDTIANALK